MFDEFLRMQVGLRRAQARARSRRDGHPSHRRRHARVAEFLEKLPFALTGDQRTRHRRDHARPREPGADAPAAAGRRRFGQDRRCAGRAARRGAGRLPGRVHGADGGARRAALPRFGPHARRPRPCAPTGRCSPSGRCTVALLTNRTTAAERRTYRGRPRGRRGRHPRRHARVALRRRAVHAARRSRWSTSSTASASSSERCCAARATSPTCW